MNWLHYLLEANLYLALFYLAYCLLLNRDTHYRLKRIYLIFSCVISFILPVLQISALRPSKPAEPLNTITYTNLPVQTFHAVKQEVAIAALAPVIAPVIKAHLTLQDGLWYIYIAGAVVLLVSFFVKLRSLYQLMRKSLIVDEGKHRVIYLPGTSTAFSFFNYLFIGTDTAGADTIIRHELVHIRQKHSMDVLLLELLKIINWFNPFIYLLQNSLKTVHEYIADEQTAAYETDALTYSSFLVMNAYGTDGSPITNSFFNYNLLKKRIIMLNQQRSGNLARLKYLVIIPICAALLGASTLAFSKTYGWVDLTPAKFKSDSRYAMLGATHMVKRKRLKITKNGVVSMSDQLSVDQKNKKVVYTAATLTKADKLFLLKNQNIKVEVVEDSTLFKTADGRLVLPGVGGDGYYLMDHFLHNNIHYTSAQGEKGGLVEVSFTLDNDRHITDLKVVKSGGAKLDVLALNGFKNYKGIVNDDAGKTLKIGVYFFTDDYSIFNDSLDKDPEFEGALIITNYKYPTNLTSKGYEYDENGGPGFVSSRVIIYEKNGEAKWFYEDKSTPADLQLLKEKYGYIFPSGSSEVAQFMHPQNIKSNHLGYIFDAPSYLDAPYSDRFYHFILDSIEYPKQAKKSFTGGIVVLNFNLDNDGIISNVNVAQSGGNGFDEAAVNALQSCKFTIKDNAGKHSIAILFCVVEKKYRPVVSDKIKTTGYIGELAVTDVKSQFKFRNGSVTIIKPN